MKIIGKSECTAEQMAQYLIGGNPKAKDWALEYAKLFLEEGEAEGVRGDGAWCQSIKETGWFKFNGGTAVTFNQNNFCGLGVTSKGKKGLSFDTPRLGIRAQIQHLKGYATSKALVNPCIDPRYSLIKPKGKAPEFEDLGGLWAVPGYNTKKASSLEEAKKMGIGYGFDIVAAVNKMKKVVVKKKEYLVAVDAGHGSDTAGKDTADGFKEHWINVVTSIYFDKAMQRCGVKTLKVAWDDYDATDDSDIALGTRQKQIKNAGCDISVSFHANAASNTSAQGIETFYHSTASKAGDSKTLATKVQNYLIKGTAQKNRGVKTANFAMCNCDAMGTRASVLVEIGFMTNQHEAKLLMTDEFCYECAEEIAQGVCEYLGVNYVKGTFAEIDVKIGDYNKNVEVPLKINHSKKDIQKFLNTYYGSEIKKVLGAELAIDGSIGAKSKKAIAIALQVELNKLNAGIAIDGSFGSKTEKAFNEYVGTLKKNTENIFVTLWQCILVGNDLDPNGIDGKFGNGCVKATNELFIKLKSTKDCICTVTGSDLNKML